MLKSKKLELSETFVDGKLTPLVSQDYIVTGELPYSIPFGNRTIGIKRYWEARAQDTEITKLVSVPLHSITKDAFEVGGIVELFDFSSVKEKKVLYKIEQAQIKADTAPPCIYLSLTNNAIQVTDRRERD